MNVPEELQCKSCKKNVDVPPTHDHLITCHTCAENFCLEHQTDRRSTYHPQYCQPGEW